MRKVAERTPFGIRFFNWEESDHPRADDGKFGPGGADGTSGSDTGKKGVDHTAEIAKLREEAEKAEDSNSHHKAEQLREKARKLEKEMKKPAKKKKREKQTSANLPIAKQIVGGLKVREEIPNMGSIKSSLNDYEILDGVREINMVNFTYHPPYSASEMERTKKLASEIKHSKELNPLIVVEDNEGFYILEGGHRFDALNMLGAKSFPCIVVKDLEKLEKKENSMMTFSDWDRLKRFFNSAAFDRASYEADGGDSWVDPERAKLFEDPAVKDPALWKKAGEASQKALGRDSWQFKLWFYKKQRGKF